MDDLYAVLRKPGGPQDLVAEWSSLAGGIGSEVALREGKRRWRGVIRGFGPDGSLILLAGKGGKKVFHSGEVTVIKRGPDKL